MVLIYTWKGELEASPEGDLGSGIPRNEELPSRTYIYLGAPSSLSSSPPPHGGVILTVREFGKHLISHVADMRASTTLIS